MSGDLPFGMPGTAWVRQVAGPAPRRNDEAKLQRSVHRYLDLALPHDAFHFAIPNGLMRSQKAAARAKGEGVTAGICDLCVIYQGRALFIELKTATGRLSMAQRAMHKRISYCGCPVMVCRRLEDVEASLRIEGVPLRTSVSA